MKKAKNGHFDNRIRKKFIAHKELPTGHPCKYPARLSLTSVIERELVYFRRYDANQMHTIKPAFYKHFQPTKPTISGPLGSIDEVSGHLKEMVRK